MQVYGKKCRPIDPRADRIVSPKYASFFVVCDGSGGLGLAPAFRGARKEAVKRALRELGGCGTMHDIAVELGVSDPRIRASIASTLWYMMTRGEVEKRGFEYCLRG